ncbi:hypothetical protein BKA62DRAFT_710329 [Auriculariales sp. MPI-PUGE-AT-0066]|nr:hypothetical protein BKA62DRAFT_710329 [Auriculariales sp. MPI-PUGE-AT-0066]
MQLLLPVLALTWLLAQATAFIASLEQAGAFEADATTSTFPLRFVTASTKVSFLDLTVAIGVSTPTVFAAASAAGSGQPMGSPLVNIDLVGLRRADTGPGSFVFDVPITQADLTDGPGAYVLTVAIVRVTGSPGSYVWRADPFNLAFNATFAP